jgi:hypothetical protein
VPTLFRWSAGEGIKSVSDHIAAPAQSLPPKFYRILTIRNCPYTAATPMKLALILAAMFIFGQGTRPATVEVQGRILVEPAYPSPFPLELTLVFESVRGKLCFADSPGRAIQVHELHEVRGGMAGQSQLQKDGRFLVLLPRSMKEAALIVRLRPNAPTSSSNRRRILFEVHASRRCEPSGKELRCWRPIDIGDPHYPREMHGADSGSMPLRPLCCFVWN